MLSDELPDYPKHKKRNSTNMNVSADTQKHSIKTILTLTTTTTHNVF